MQWIETTLFNFAPLVLFFYPSLSLAASFQPPFSHPLSPPLFSLLLLNFFHIIFSGRCRDFLAIFLRSPYSSNTNLLPYFHRRSSFSTIESTQYSCYILFRPILIEHNSNKHDTYRYSSHALDLFSFNCLFLLCTHSILFVWRVLYTNLKIRRMGRLLSSDWVVEMLDI